MYTFYTVLSRQHVINAFWIFIVLVCTSVYCCFHRHLILFNFSITWNVCNKHTGWLYITFFMMTAYAYDALSYFNNTSQYLLKKFKDQTHGISRIIYKWHGRAYLYYKKLCFVFILVFRNIFYNLLLVSYQNCPITKRANCLAVVKWLKYQEIYLKN